MQITTTSTKQQHRASLAVLRIAFLFVPWIIEGVQMHQSFKLCKQKMLQYSTLKKVFHLFKYTRSLTSKCEPYHHAVPTILNFLKNKIRLTRHHIRRSQWWHEQLIINRAARCRHHRLVSIRGHEESTKFLRNRGNSRLVEIYGQCVVFLCV